MKTVTIHKNLLERIVATMFVIFLVYSCVQDDFSNYRDVSFQEINDYKFDKISFSNLKNNTKALQKIKEISNLKNKASGSAYRKVYDEQFGVFIDTTQVVMLSNENDHTINFRIVSEGENDKEVENLVLRSRQNGEYSAYVTKYEISDNDLQDASLVSLTPIENNYQINSNGVGIGFRSDCIEVRTYTAFLCEDRDGNTIEENGDVTGKCHQNFRQEERTIIYIDLKCMGGGAGSGTYTGSGGYGSGGYDYGNGFDYGGSYGGGSGGGGGNSSNPNNPGNGTTNPQNPIDGSLNDYGIFNPFPTTPVLGQLTPPQQEPIDHIAELNKITDKDAETPFRAKIDEYVGMLDTTEVEAGIIYVKETDGSYSVVEPVEVGFRHVNYPNAPYSAEVRMHLHHNYIKPNGDTGHSVPSSWDVISFVNASAQMYKKSKANKWTDIIVTRNGLYAFRAIDKQKIIDFHTNFSPSNLRNEFEKEFKIQVTNYSSDQFIKQCSSGCTDEQKRQIQDLAGDEGFSSFLKEINKKYDTGVGLFKGILNPETGNYDWQQ